MAVQNDPVVLALRAALARDDSPALRIALGNHLLGATAAAEALTEFEAALRMSPTDAAALAGAESAARASGDPVRADAYALALRAAPSGEALASDAVEENAEETRAPANATAKVTRLRLVGDPGEAPAPDDALTIRFADVGGMEEVKQRLQRSFISPVKNPELFERFGKQIGGGLVLYGPPGCGKTFLARALAGEIGARFLNIGLNEVLDMWFGESERKLHELFENARRQQPTLVFFDEVDALGQRRTQLKGAAGRTLVNQLLSELDGFDGRNRGVFFLAATNHPWDLDPALRRPGRFDRLVFVPPPDVHAREVILRLKLESRPTAAGVDLAAIAKATDGFSGADLEALVADATDVAIEASLEAGSELPIDDRALRSALRGLKASTRPWFEVARNYAVFANEGGVYDDLLSHVKRIGLA